MNRNATTSSKARPPPPYLSDGLDVGSRSTLSSLQDDFPHRGKSSYDVPRSIPRSVPRRVNKNLPMMATTSPGYETIMNPPAPVIMYPNLVAGMIPASVFHGKHMKRTVIIVIISLIVIVIITILAIVAAVLIKRHHDQKSASISNSL